MRQSYQSEMFKDLVHFPNNLNSTVVLFKGLNIGT